MDNGLLLRLFAAFLISSLLAPAAQAATFTVDDNGDGADDRPGNGICATSVTTGGVCTLRAAIQEANALSGSDTIEFSIGTSSIINIGTELPAITEPVVIDGTTAPVGAIDYVRVDGCAGCDGLTISADDTAIYGLQVVRFGGTGIVITGSDNVIENCQVGDFLSSGTPAGYGNDGDGIRIEGGGLFNRIGGSSTDARNIISGNGGHGIVIDGGDPGQTNNRIDGNYIGVAADGATDLGNSQHGIYITNQASSNVIGSSQVGDPGNVISGNGDDGIHLHGTFGNADAANTSDNFIGRNRIGVNDAGDAAVSNGESGIDIRGATGTPVGSSLAAKNIISGNTRYGVRVFGTDVTIAGNYIGPDASGSVALGNGTGSEGIIVVSASSNITIGGTRSADRNVISGNQRGITLFQAADCTIQGNYIGVASDGTSDLGNTFHGIKIYGTTDASGNLVGGTASGAGNVISGNGEEAVWLSGTAATNNTVQGNTIGTNAAGDAALANKIGVLVDAGASNNTIGGTSSAARNVISGNTAHGVVLSDPSSEGTTGNGVQGNYIGPDAAGTGDIGNGGFGVNVAFARQNTIGGGASGAGNIISGNGGNTTIGFAGTGVNIDSGDQTVVRGNRIGTDANGDPMGNDSRGIGMDRASDVMIGGSSEGDGNTIAHNDGRGVSIFSSTSTSLRNTVRRNAIYANGGSGIDLGSDNTTSNDAGDSDTGSNRLQNFPEIPSADYDAGANAITLMYRLPSDPSASGAGASVYPLTVDFYRSDPGGEGAAYLGTDTYASADYTGGPDKQITFTPAASVTRSDQIVATATDANGNTSEFTATARQLPVELTTFDVQARNASVQLSWATASETSNAGFAVQRKHAPDAPFEQVGFVEGQGTTARPQHYRFEDNTLPYAAQRVTYRLKQVDTDGTAHYSAEVEVNTGAPKAVALHSNYPNPAYQATTIRYELPQATHVRLALYDVLGRRVAVLVDRKQTAGRKSMQVETGDLASGVYMYRLDAGSAVTVRRMTVTH